MAVRYQLVIDCADPELLAHFWAAALGYELEPPPAGFATWDDWRRDLSLPETEMGLGADSIIDPAGTGSRIWFQVVPESRTQKNRVHIDLEADDREKEITRLLELGATRGADHDEYGHSWTIMADPEGNEFCVA